jgi:tetratricopeptide (TPR) repeat protein
MDHARNPTTGGPSSSASGGADALRAIGDARLSEGLLDDAMAAFEQALELEPGDVATLVDLGHAAYANGQADVALRHLQDAADRDPGNVDLLRSISAVQRRVGRPDDALATAREVARRRAEDPAATLDVAELSLDEGRLDEAVAAFRRLRAIDLEPGHEVFVWHGLLAAEIRRGAWRRALELAVEAAAVDRHRRTTELLAFVTAQVFGPAEDDVPSREGVDHILAESRAEHRLLHVEPLAF